MGGSARRRSTRDWVVDISLFTLSTLFGLVLVVDRLAGYRMPDPAWLFPLDVVTWVAASAGLWWRRRWPVQYAAVLVLLGTFSELSALALLIALFTVAIHRPPATTMVVYALCVPSSIMNVVLRPEPDIAWQVVLAFGIVVQGAAVGWGLFIHHRRELIESLRDRAARAETEAHLRAEQVQHEVREAIAREIHDVLGHRLSLLSVHAGALEYRPDAPAADVARAAKVIRENSHQALQDLREVIGVLRAPVGELPQPTFADLAQLVAESAGANMRVSLRSAVEGDVPDTAGRTVYRIVQESLTNARKHAAGSEVDVRVSGSSGDGITVEVVNSRPFVGSSPNAEGRGLLGLAERVALAHGTLEHGVTGAGGWRISAWLPWPL
ncbi:sensor histidine kinase [Umezawaea endophytica]|uniref:histidine kinase n=1 Tax=Umezawaea endophytica TaxID=1654476 RepID=A0A9X3AJ39_9PSEU|nr:histidine kinase [Umezawaea endophytica]MCS7483992.1 histidine kinase [Umezawaea endophytica]